MKEVTVAAIQLVSAIGAPGENATRMKAWLNRSREQGADIAFFPEGSLTGYTTEHAGEVALELANNASFELEERARSLGIAVGYGLAERDASTDALYQTYVVADESARLVYRKTHLGRREQGAYSAGNDLPVADIAGIRLGVQLCWEGHIPDIATTLRSKGAELIVEPHAGGLGGRRRVESWNRFLPARASDNGVFVVACNALQPLGQPNGATRHRETGGGLAAYGPNGRLLGSYAGPDEHILIVHVGGNLPREGEDGMRSISYFDRRRPELYTQI